MLSCLQTFGNWLEGVARFACGLPTCLVPGHAANLQATEYAAECGRIVPTHCCFCWICWAHLGGCTQPYCCWSSAAHKALGFLGMSDLLISISPACGGL